MSSNGVEFKPSVCAHLFYSGDLWEPQELTMALKFGYNVHFLLVIRYEAF